jgi:hypothetical protein
VFQLPSQVAAKGDIRFGEVKKHFPLPGQYHFRFRKSFRNGFVWLDLSDDSAIVPVCEGVYMAKVSRLSAPGAGIQQPNAAVGASMAAGASLLSPASAAGGKVGGRPHSVARLVSVGEHDWPKAGPTMPAAGSEGDLLGMSTGTAGSSSGGTSMGSNPGVGSDDLLGMFNAAPQAQTRVPPPPQPLQPNMGSSSPVQQARYNASGFPSPPPAGPRNPMQAPPQQQAQSTWQQQQFDAFQSRGL